MAVSMFLNQVLPNCTYSILQPTAQLEYGPRETSFAISTASSPHTLTHPLALYPHSHTNPHSTHSTLAVKILAYNDTTCQSYSIVAVSVRAPIHHQHHRRPSPSLPLDNHWVSFDQIDGDGETGDFSLALDRKRYHRFSDNTPRLGCPVLSPAQSHSVTPPTQSGFSTSTTHSQSHSHSSRVLQVLPSNILNLAHYGYIYCMVLLFSPLQSPSGRQQQQKANENTGADAGLGVLLVTSSGDESIKKWECSMPQGPVLLGMQSR